MEVVAVKAASPLSPDPLGYSLWDSILVENGVVTFHILLWREDHRPLCYEGNVGAQYSGNWNLMNVDMEYDFWII